MAVLITGGTSGLGREMVRRFSAEGARVAFTGRDPARGAEVAAAQAARFIAADVRSDPATKAAVTEAVETLGGLDILVLNAGTGLVAPLLDTPVAEFERVMDVNVTGCLRYAQAGIPHLERNGGSILVIASDAGVLGESEVGAYSVSKAAAIMLGRMLALDCGPRGVRCNVICPGDIEPGMREMLAPGEGERRDDASQWRLPPIGRVGQAADVASAALFLASDEAAFCNGSVLLVDGGMRAGLARGQSGF